MGLHIKLSQIQIGFDFISLLCAKMEMLYLVSFLFDRQWALQST